MAGQLSMYLWLAYHVQQFVLHSFYFWRSGNHILSVHSHEAAFECIKINQQSEDEASNKFGTQMPGQPLIATKSSVAAGPFAFAVCTWA